MLSQDIFAELSWRGLVYDATPGIDELLRKESTTHYIGFDPTAASLHVGSLLPMMTLARMQRAGHSPIALVGGGTGLIGDPSGKTVERQLLDESTAARNVAGIRSQLELLLDFDAKNNPAQIVNNLDWLGGLSYIEFLRDVGKHFTVNYMTAKESVKRRLTSEEGISYTEFSYMLLQAYDFAVLHERYGCTLQMGGSDQWGNIVAGIELIRKLRSGRADGIVLPLVTSASGVKFGKTESGAVWLDADLTSPYRFYQFWYNTDDRDAANYLRYFTWLDEPKITELEQTIEESPEQREAQKRLAEEVTRMIHGENGLSRALQATEVLFGGAVDNLTEDEILDVFEDIPSADFERFRFEGDGVRITDLLAESGLAQSKGEARRLVQGGGINLNNRRVMDDSMRVSVQDTIGGKILVLRRGQKNYRVVQLV